MSEGVCCRGRERGVSLALSSVFHSCGAHSCLGRVIRRVLAPCARVDKQPIRHFPQNSSVTSDLSYFPQNSIFTPDFLFPQNSTLISSYFIFELFDLFKVIFR